MNDWELKGVSYVVVDEIYEWGMNEDFLLIVLKDFFFWWFDFCFVLMSVILNVDLFLFYFNRVFMVYILGFIYFVKFYFLEDILEIIGYCFIVIN